MSLTFRYNCCDIRWIKYNQNEWRHFSRYWVFGIGYLLSIYQFSYLLIYFCVLAHLETDDFQYDVFVSFSTLDYPWVRDSLTPMLERKQINYCIHSRDFVVGKAIIENMADSVYNSRKVLAVISQNYLASHFCREELEIALYRCTKMADSSLLLIRVDDVDKKNLPKTLRRRTFLDYSSAMERSEWEQRLLKHIQVDESDAKIDTRKSSDKCQLI